jgi:large conductance mechanosensitive channel
VLLSLRKGFVKAGGQGLGWLSMSLLKDFRDFALKGNVIDLAIGVIIGAAFGGIVNSLVNDVLMPPIGKLVGGLDFSNLYLSLDHKVDIANQIHASTQPASTEGMLGNAASLLGMSGRLALDDARKVGPVIAYGKFLTNLINLIIVAFCMFMVVKAMTVAHKKFEREKAAAPPPPPPPQEVLLAEIRDILKERKS